LSAWPKPGPRRSPPPRPSGAASNGTCTTDSSRCWCHWLSISASPRPGSGKTPAAHALLARAHADAKTAIEELRSLVRGIHPSVLDGRGLDAALSALIASCPVPVTLHVDLPQRPDSIREAAAYYVAAEAITNITKHASARRATVTVEATEHSLHVVIEDDGNGGARIEPCGGLAGLAARIGSIDGTFTVSSPPGGPTRVEAVIPCEP
jgi:signal transduction histidine kinase